jgi:catechol 2,3-dioxygenase-like lactoylglutathione lyase family enzyme
MGDSLSEDEMKLIQSRIVTRDVPSLARFYEELTGIVPNGSDEYVEFNFLEGALAICSKRSADIFGGGAAVPAANRSLILDFEVKDVDKERTRLRDLVTEFVLEPTNQPWGNRSMIFRDPDGNLINFYTIINDRPGNCLENGSSRNNS